MSHEVISALGVGFAAGIFVDGLIFDWPFRKRKRR